MTSEQDPINGKPEIGDLVDIKYKTILKGHPLISRIPNVRNEIRYSFVIGSGIVDTLIEEKICGITVGESICITTFQSSDPLFISEISSFNTEAPPTTDNGENDIGNFKIIIQLLSIIKKENVPDIVASTKRIFTSPIQRMQLSLDSKNLGNHYYNLGDYHTAKIHYENSIKYLDSFEEWTLEQQNDSKPIKISALLNISNCMIKLEEHKFVPKYCTEILNLDKNNIKALYLRATSYLKLNDPDEARIDLYKAATLEPQNVEIRTKLQQCTKIINDRKNLKKKKQNTPFLF
ncbi:peptidylprolyl isomerase [Cryptosporidium ubiquitum]|uniref:Peptidylprolyl isomerase n=1 Tax=Cryptosporidium ubiquitum TaxID=857276 RepID=A0A1J4MIL7_9CRYT|nr:peptidylprolyl isomerase [Cryptosporidium ubiquitum]OII74022.1 peptidylprolyl isomerase [Cryptosporidium ubiquitum]